MNRAYGYRLLDPAALARLQNLGLVARGVVEGSITGLHHSPYHGFSIEFAEHRAYAPGDSPRYLDWRMLARTDRLYVKQYEAQTNLKAQLILDVSGSMRYASGRGVSKLHYGATLCAVLAYLLVRQQDAVGLTIFDGAVLAELPPRSSTRHLSELLKLLEGAAFGETLPPSAQATAVADALHAVAQRAKRRRLMILVSDLYDDPQTVLRALHHFRHDRHEVLVFHVFDQAELELPFAEPQTLIDLETGERLLIDPAYVRDEYRRTVQEFIADYRRACADCRVDYVQTHTGVPYDVMLSHYLAGRARR